MFGKFVGAGEIGASTWNFTTTSSTSYYQIHAFSNLRSTVPAFMGTTTRGNATEVTSVTPLDIHTYMDGAMQINVYYFAPGDQTKIKAIPKGLHLLGLEETYMCGPGDPLQPTPTYGCRGAWATNVTFPDCINTSRLADEATNAVYSRSGVCPSTHPYRIPRINYLVMHDNIDGVVPNPLRVSAGVNAWADYTFMHADYFAANQPVFNNELLDLCLRNAPDSVTFASPRYGEAP